jgi:hypothetical protein
MSHYNEKTPPPGGVEVLGGKSASIDDVLKIISWLPTSAWILPVIVL